MSRYAFVLNMSNIDLITFLNDGVRPEIDNKQYQFCFVEINGPNEITTKIMTPPELFSRPDANTIPIIK